MPLWHGHGVGIALFSYDGTMMWGFNADYDVMEDVESLVAAVRAAFDELLAAARGKAKAPAPAGARSSHAPKKRPPLGTKPAKEPAPKSTAAKKTAAKKPAAKKTAAKKTAAKKPAVRGGAAPGDDAG